MRTQIVHGTCEAVVKNLRPDAIDRGLGKIVRIDNQASQFAAWIGTVADGNFDAVDKSRADGFHQAVRRLISHVSAIRATRSGCYEPHRAVLAVEPQRAEAGIQRPKLLLRPFLR